MKPTSGLSAWLKKGTEGKRLSEWISYVMVFAVLLMFIVGYGGDKKDWHFFGTVLTLAALLVANILWFQSFHSFVSVLQKNIAHTVFFILTNGLVLLILAFGGPRETVFLLFLQAAQFSSTFGVWPRGSLFSILLLFCSLVIFYFQGITGTTLVQTSVQIGLGILFVLVTVVLEERARRQARRVEGLLADLQVVNGELKASQEREKDLAIAEERMRMARDIHDGLGHHLTVLSIQLQAADKLVERNPQAAAEAIRTSRTEVAAALEEVRRSVGVMRKTPVERKPLDRMLEDLVTEFSRHTGLQTSFEPMGTPVELSEFAVQTLFRTVQESLTNIHKHASHPKSIQVTLEYCLETIHLAVSDDGEKPDLLTIQKTGYGLQGLRERVDQLSGKFCCGPGAMSGFQVDVTLPMQEARRD